MDREIKFRAFMQPLGDGEPEEMCYDIAYEDYEPVNDLLSNTPNLMQYTGLQDKNGVDIYEGDIVKWDDGTKGKYWRIATVKWDECGQWCFSVKAGTSINCFKHESHDFGMGRFGYSPDINSFGNELYVIGNIFENPELIEPKNGK